MQCCTCSPLSAIPTMATARNAQAMDSDDDLTDFDLRPRLFPRFDPSNGDDDLANGPGLSLDLLTNKDDETPSALEPSTSKRFARVT